MNLTYTIQDIVRHGGRLVFRYSSHDDGSGSLVSSFDAEYFHSQGNRRTETMGSLLLVKNGAPEVKFTLGDVAIIGRSSDCDVQLLDTQLSRRHTQIERKDGEFWVRDLESRNGTYLGDARIEEPCRLTSGDEIRVGGLSLIFDPIVELLHARDSEAFVCLVDEDTAKETEFEQLNADLAKVDRDSILAIHSITCELVATLDMEILLDTFLDRFIEYFDADRGFILLKDARSRKLKPAAIRANKSSIALSRTLMERAVESKNPILVHNALEDVSFVGSRSIVEHQLRSVMLVPLLAKGEVIGLLQIDKEEKDAYDQTSLAKLSMLAGSASLSIENARRYRAQKQRSESLASGRVGGTRFIGDNPRIQKLLADTDKAAASDARVLITGESGTGKELIARMIHERSARSTGPWIAINCAAIPENLLESELFGHEKGAFTGASKLKRGCFEMADGGTLFLDEIAELPARMQVKLLRALQDSCFYRLGSERSIHVDIRVVAATNRDLAGMISDGSFREDLYYRLNVVALSIPPLRERRDDIEPMVHFFAERIGHTLGKKPKVSSLAIARLKEYPWPGNVRELQNIIERVLVLGDSQEITAQDLPVELTVLHGKTGTELGNLHAVLATTERELLVKALAETKGNKSAACRLLGISRPTMDKKIAEYSIEI